MDKVSAPENLPQTIISDKTNNKPQLVFLMLVMMVVGFLLGFGVNRLLISKKTQIKVPTIAQPLPQKIDESKLPISLPLLQNPIVYQWRGAVEGTLVAKSDDSITIKDDKENSIIIPNRVSSKSEYPSIMPFFVDKSDPKGKIKKITINDLIIGSRLRGDFFVVPGNKNSIVGSSFEVIKKPTP